MGGAGPPQSRPTKRDILHGGELFRGQRPVQVAASSLLERLLIAEGEKKQEKSHDVTLVIPVLSNFL